MMRSAQIVLLGVARFYIPLIALFACALLVLYTPGAGVGFAAGLAFALALALHMIAFGAAAARMAAPPVIARVLISLGLSAAFAAAAAPGFVFAAQAMEGGLFAVTAGASALILSALTGRAPSLSDEDW